MSPVQRFEPFDICVPLTEPCSTILRHVQIRVFKHLQRQTSLPVDLLELQTPIRILPQIADRQITKAQLTIRAMTSKQQRLTIRTRSYPDDVFINVAIVD